MFKIYMLIFLFAHILGDFYFQTKDLAENKNKAVIKLVQHIGIYYLVSLIAVIPVFSIEMLLAISILSLGHGMIDFIKYLHLSKKIHRRKSSDEERTIYLIDQGVHLACIAGAAYVMALNRIPIIPVAFLNQFFTVIHLDKVKTLSWIIMLLFIFKPANISIKKLLSGYKPSNEESEKKEEQDEKKAGGFIGALERLIILFLLSINQFSAIGLVLTAKSVARYSKITEDKNFAEYYLLGTLLSTVLVIGIYLLINF